MSYNKVEKRKLANKLKPQNNIQIIKEKTK